MSEMKLPQEWAAELGVRIMDPDGWRHSVGEYPPRSFDEPIDEDEFVARMGPSTIGPVNWGRTT